ncbi:putative TPR-repeat protein [Trypanosoma conorhini]|uniref:Putative TPR-repeat protein n=1 Tax=Trypanosoma conorhini TaxID=83891 RepID=A0A3R7PC35_9TRYP|nr:putative TPR-repeat protein [Trypanosoma conorhini]RNF16246.1 putative TPR-repeat protein [Trypanosoma conorhini]
MEAALKEEGLHTGTSSSSSSFASRGNSPSRRRAPENGVTSALPFGRPNAFPSEVESPSAVWLERFMSTYFLCELCHKIVVDPVQVLPSAMMTCRKCALSRRVSVDAMAELPLGVVQAIEELFEARRCHRKNHVTNSPEARATSRAGDDSIAGRRIVRVKRGDAVPGNKTARHLTSHAANADSVKAANPTVFFQELQDADEEESRQRETIDATEAGERLELLKKHSAFVRTIKGRSKDSSKALKAEADATYEKAEYTLALELYSKAIEQQPLDRLTRLSALYGNRSSAYFMAQRYGDCISDCLKAISLEPGNVRMYTRAAKAAAVMGDIARAVAQMDTIPENLVTDSMLAEKKKYKSGLELLQRAERAFGTPEGDEIWLMLVAQFSDTIPFRLRYAESLFQQKRYLKAVEALEAVSPFRRSPRLWYMMANCLYLSGFEHFERARLCLVDVQQLDESCAKLLKLINVVDEGKQKGNQLFQQKKFAAAVEHYTSAINAAENNNQILRILYCNRAAAHKELGRYRDGIEDCTKAIQLDPEFSKAYARRARCHQQLSNFTAAIRDFKSAIQYDPSDHELVRELRNCEHGFTKEAEREKDYYYVLGVSRTSSEREIKLKYRELSLRWHPDKCMGLPDEERMQAERKFKIIGEAHATLIDPVKRREYELKLDRERMTRSGAFAGFGAHGSDTFRGQASRYRSNTTGYW